MRPLSNKTPFVPTEHIVIQMAKTYLAIWTLNQRKAYWSFIYGKKHAGSQVITLDRIRKLNAVGFPYDPTKKGQSSSLRNSK